MRYNQLKYPDLQLILIRFTSMTSIASNTPTQWMQLALEQAKLAWQQGEVPVGAVIVLNNKLVATGYNKSISSSDPSMHAEVDAIRAAGQVLENYRLIDCELYVTLEPCMMCLGAMLHARIKKLYFGTVDPKTGVLGGQVNLIDYYTANHNIEVHRGLCEQQCSDILKDFFKARRCKNLSRGC